MGGENGGLMVKPFQTRYLTIIILGIYFYHVTVLCLIYYVSVTLRKYVMYNNILCIMYIIYTYRHI